MAKGQVLGIGRGGGGYTYWVKHVQSHISAELPSYLAYLGPPWLARCDCCLCCSICLDEEGKS